MPTLRLSTHSQAYYTLYFQTRRSHYLKIKKPTIKLTIKNLTINLQHKELTTKLAKLETNN